MQWWCAAQGIPWSWTWRPYPGVWLFVAVVALLGWRWTRRSGRTRRQTGFFLGGLLLLWAALDWPIGALGAGYLASVHMLQFLLIVYYAPPLLLLGLRPTGVDDAGARARRSSMVRRLTHPLLLLVLFLVITVTTHLPVVTDSLMGSQAGSFLVDTAWLAAGLAFWWPILMPGSPAWFVPLVRMGYLIASMVLMTAPTAMITFSELPVYATFELAPPIPGISPLQDQRLAGIWMRMGAGIAVWSAISILFYRWSRRETLLIDEEMEAQHRARDSATR